MLYYIIMVFHVLVCLFLIGVVLLQSGKAADLAGAFGGMGSQTAFGPRGATTLLHKLTTGSAIVFMITSLTLSILATNQRGGSSVLERGGKAQSSQPAGSGKTTVPTPGAPAAPATGGPQPSVTFVDEKTGSSKTVPLNIPPPPGQSAPAQGQQSAPTPQQAPAKK